MTPEGIRGVFESTQYACGYCNRCFEQRDELLCHVGPCHNVCQFCGKMWDSWGSLWNHITQGGCGANNVTPTEQQNTLKCCFCPMHFRNIQPLLQHQHQHQQLAHFNVRPPPEVMSGVLNVKGDKVSHDSKKMSHGSDSSLTTSEKKASTSDSALTSSNKVSQHSDNPSANNDNMLSTSDSETSGSDKVTPNNDNVSSESDKVLHAVVVTNTGLSSHKELKKRKYHFQCYMCPEKFTYKRSILQHQRSAHQNPTKNHSIAPVKCHHCFMTFNSEMDLRAHYELRHWNVTPSDNVSHDNDLKSQVNDEVLNESDNFSCHSEEESQKYDSLLQKCDKVSQELKVKNTHFKCLYCSQKFIYKSDVVRHEKNVHSARRHSNNECQYCGKLYSYHQSMLNHEIFAHASRKYGCFKCGLSFKEKVERVAHNQLKHMTTSVMLERLSQNDMSPAACVRRDKAKIARYLKQKHPHAVRGTEADKKVIENDMTNDSCDILYDCDKCYMSFKSVIDCRRHKCIKREGNNDKVICDKCHMSLKSDMDLKCHFQLTHMTPAVKMTKLSRPKSNTEKFKEILKELTADVQPSMVTNIPENLPSISSVNSEVIQNQPESESQQGAAEYFDDFVMAGCDMSDMTCKYEIEENCDIKSENIITTDFEIHQAKIEKL